MSKRNASDSLLGLWRRLSSWPGGSTLFSWLLGRKVRYTGSIGARVVLLEPGHARAEMRDRAAVRNHLGSVHAIALINLGELVTGLAVTTQQPPDGRAIVTHLEIDYFKKSRGTITAEARAGELDWSREGEAIVESSLTNPAGDQVARVKAVWRIGRKVPRA